MEYTDRPFWYTFKPWHKQNGRVVRILWAYFLGLGNAPRCHKLKVAKLHRVQSRSWSLHVKSWNDICDDEYNWVWLLSLQDKVDDTYSLMYVVSSTGDTGTPSSAERIDGQHALTAVENLQVSLLANFKTFDATVVMVVFLIELLGCVSCLQDCWALRIIFCYSCEPFFAALGSNDDSFKEWRKALSLKASLSSECNFCWHCEPWGRRFHVPIRHIFFLMSL